MVYVCIGRGQSGEDEPVRATGVWAQRCQVGGWELEIGMKIRRLAEDPFGVGATHPHFPPLGTKSQASHRSLLLGTKMYG